MNKGRKKGDFRSKMQAFPLQLNHTHQQTETTLKPPKMSTFMNLHGCFTKENENGVKGRKKRCLPLHGSTKQHQRERKMVFFDC